MHPPRVTSQAGVVDFGSKYSVWVFFTRITLSSVYDCCVEDLLLTNQEHQSMCLGHQTPEMPQSATAISRKENKRNPKAGPQVLIHPVIIGSPETPRAVAAAKWSNQNVNKLHNSRPPPLSTHQHHHRSKRKHDFDNHVHLIPAY